MRIIFLHHTNILGSGIDTVFHQLAHRLSHSHKVTYATFKSDYITPSYNLKMFNIPYDSRVLQNLSFFYPKTILWAYKLMKKHDFAICSSFPMALAYFSLRKSSPTKIFIGWGYAPSNLFDNPIEKTYIKIAKYTELLALKKSEIRLSPSKYVQKLYKEKHGITTEKLYLDGIDFNTFNFTKYNKDYLLKNKYKQFAGKKIIIFVGNMAPHKNIEYLIEATKLTLKYEENLTLVLVGRTSYPLYYKKIQKMVHDLNISQHVYFAGRLKWHELAEFYSISDVFVSPSLYEGFLRAEAFAFKIPMIAFDVASHSETITDQKTGLLVKDISEETLAEAIVELLADEDKRKSLGENGYLWAKKNLDFDVIANKFQARLEMEVPN